MACLPKGMEITDNLLSPPQGLLQVLGTSFDKSSAEADKVHAQFSLQDVSPDFQVQGGLNKIPNNTVRSEATLQWCSEIKCWRGGVRNVQRPAVGPQCFSKIWDTSATIGICVFTPPMAASLSLPLNQGQNEMMEPISCNNLAKREHSWHLQPL